MFGKILLILGLVATGLLLLIVNVTTPTDSGAAGILAVFLLGYIVTLVLVTFLLTIASRFTIKLGKEFRLLRAGEPLPLKKAYYYASVIALAPVIMISLQSVGGVGLYEVSLIAVFVGLGCLYIARRTR